MESSTVLVKSCPAYEPGRLLECARECLEHTDPGCNLIGPGKKVLLKVNMLSAKPPVKAVTTHPELVTAVAKACAQRQAEVLIGDSPAGPEKGIARYWEKTGLAAVPQAADARLVNFEAAGTFHADIDGTSVHISNVVKEVDTIINLPKLKTHNLTMMTGAVKNMYGVLPGFQKGAIHAKRPRVDDFCRFLVHLYRYVEPAITIMDAITIMEGNGPSGGDPKDVGLILACTDGVAVDHVAARIMGFGQDDIATNRIASALTNRSIQDVETMGDVELLKDTHEIVLPSHLKTVRLQAWLLEHTPNVVFRILSKLLWIRPKITEECTQCGECVEGCPKNALAIVDERVVVDEKLCVACLRCQEVCQRGAVRLKLSLLARIIWG